MTCCANQSPRIAERTGRLFCANCRAYLDARPGAPPATPAAQGRSEGAEADNRVADADESTPGLEGAETGDPE